MDNGDVLLRFGARVRERRVELAMSQEDLAAVSGLDRTYISGIERGKRNVGLRNVAVIATSLRTSLADLVRDL